MILSQPSGVGRKCRTPIPARLLPRGLNFSVSFCATAPLIRPEAITTAVRTDFGRDLEFPTPDWALIGVNELGSSRESTALEHLGRRVLLSERVGAHSPKSRSMGALTEAFSPLYDNQVGLRIPSQLGWATARKTE